MNAKVVAMLIASASLISTPAISSTNVSVGEASSGNCYPFGCFTYEGGTLYQQVYTASAFSTPVSIHALGFANYGAAGGDLGDATFSIEFFLTSRPSNALSSDLASNRGDFLGNFGSFQIAGLAPSNLTLTGTAFNYDPSLGNLLMQVTTLSVSRTADYRSYFVADHVGEDTSRAFTNADGTHTGIGALRTTFTVTPLSAVPESATWAMMLAGFGLMGSALRTRRKSLVPAT